MQHNNALPTLVLNSAEGILQLVLGQIFPKEGFEIVHEVSVPAASRGAELLTPELKNILHSCNLVISDIKRIACVRGPGSFTGIRLGLTTALGIARACGATLAGLDYLSLLAATAIVHCKDIATHCCSRDTAWAILHARRNEVVLQGFSKDLTPCTPILACSPADAVHIMRSHGTPLAVFGSGLLRNAQELESLFPEAAPYFLLKDFTRLSPQSLLHAASKAVYNISPIEPSYIRACDAEQNLPEIARNMGQNPDEAVRKLSDLTNRLA